VLDIKWTQVARRDHRGKLNGVTLNQGGKELSHITCNCCGVKGHYSTGCPKIASIAPDKWFKPKNPVLAQGGMEPEDEQSEPETDTEQVRSGTSSNRNSRSRSRAHNRRNSQEAEETDDEDGWAAVQVKSDDEPAQGLVLKQQSKWTSLAGKIILDTGSTISATIMNPDFLTDIRPATKPMTMSTNAGSKRLSMVGNIPGFGTAYFDPTGIANIFGFSHLAKLGSIFFDSGIDSTIRFEPHGRKDKTIEFKRMPEGLYAYQPDSHFLNTVAFRKRLLSPPKTEQVHHAVEQVDDAVHL
jgi:hypothetical protein